MDRIDRLNARHAVYDRPSRQRATNGHRSVDEITEAASVPAEQDHAMLASLASIDAVQLPF